MFLESCPASMLDSFVRPSPACFDYGQNLEVSFLSCVDTWIHRKQVLKIITAHLEQLPSPLCSPSCSAVFLSAFLLSGIIWHVKVLNSKLSPQPSAKTPAVRKAKVV